MTKTTTLGLALVLAALAAPAIADGAADDLAAVKKAVASSEEARPLPEATPRPRGTEPRWLRVRIQEKGEEKARVKINLPLGLVRALGDDWPLPECGRHGHHGAKAVTLGEVLRALDSGESLVEIDDEDATVRVWVE
jgi:hypothetical protein